MNAIFDLQPEIILTVCDSSGSAGGDLFLNWIKLLFDYDCQDEFDYVGLISADEKAKLEEWKVRYKISSYRNSMVDSSWIPGALYFKYILITSTDK